MDPFPSAGRPPPRFYTWETLSTIGSLGSKVAECDDEASSISQIVYVRNGEAFTLDSILEPFVPQDGPFAGRQMLQLVPYVPPPVKTVPRIRTLTVFNLPPECRTRIWDQLLEKDVVFCCGGWFGWSERFTRQAWGFSWWGLSIAYTNKDVAAEILPMLYGANIFAFRDLETFRKFLERIGSQRRFIRHVAFLNGGALGAPVPGIAHHMLDMTKLQSVTINHEAITGHNLGDNIPTMRIDDVFAMFKPFLEAWHNANKDSTGTSEVLELVGFIKRIVCPECKGFLTADGLRCARSGTVHLNISCGRSQLRAQEVGHFENVAKRFSTLVGAKFPGAGVQGVQSGSLTKRLRKMGLREMAPSKYAAYQIAKR